MPQEVERCPATWSEGSGFKAEHDKCRLEVGHPMPHKGWDVRWYDKEEPDE